MGRGRSLFFYLFVLSVATASFAEHTTNSDTATQQEKKPRVVVSREENHVQSGAMFVVRENVKGDIKEKAVAYIYFDEKEYPHVADAYSIAEKDGEFQDKQGRIVQYSKGDILFRTSDKAWYRAKPSDKKMTELKLPVYDKAGKEKKSLVVFAKGQTPIELTPWERDTVQATNEFRATEGLFPLTVSSYLMGQARLKAYNMAQANSMSHNLPPGGFQENISWNTYGGFDAAQQWWLSRSEQGHPGISHYKNMKTMAPSIGVGQSFESSNRSPYNAQIFK